MNIETIVYQTALANGMPDKLAKLITAQSKHESGNYTSPVFKANTNLFGYKYVGQKLATRGTGAPSNEGDNYAKYKNVADSVTELTSWIKRRQKEKKFPADLRVINTAELYAGLLKGAGYYGAPMSEYITGLKRFFKDNLPGAAATGISTAAIVVIAATAIFYLSK